MLRLAVLASGRGSNLRALVDAIGRGELDARIVGVFSDKANAGALAHARDAGIPAVHVVIPALDAGPVIAQTRIAIAPGDSAEALAARLLPKEHALLVQVVRWCSEGRLRFDAERIVFDERRLTGPLPVD